MKSKLIWAAIGGLLVLGALSLGCHRFFAKANTPILIGDGSMDIESKGVKLSAWDKKGNELKHPHANKRIHKVTKDGIEVMNCDGLPVDMCIIKATWSNGFIIKVRDSGGAKITLEGPGLSFDTGWKEKSEYKWEYPLDPSVTLVDIEGSKDNGKNWMSPPLCTGPNCTIEMNYY